MPLPGEGLRDRKKRLLRQHISDTATAMFLARGFDPATRFYLEDGGQVVGYSGFLPGGRVSYPWCRPGHETRADELLTAVLAAMRARGLPRAFAAYHAGWAAQADFFLRHGFARAREVLNFIQDILELPTLMSRSRPTFTELRPGDVPDLMAMAPALWRGQSPAAIERHLLQNPYVPPESHFVLRYRTGGKMEPKFNVWIRAMEALPDEPALHQSILAYASDLMLLDSSLIAHGTTVFDQRIQGASLDHALWFHRPFRADEWLLYSQDSPSTSGARGFSRGLIFDRQGRLVASVAQEGLIRLRRQ